MKQLLAIGEALIDFTPNEAGRPLKDVLSFTRNCGGAPANVCAAVAKLGGEAAFITQLGKDAFGDHIVEVLADCGVQTGYIRRTGEANTALAFVSLDAEGNREFSFYRKPTCADKLLSADQVEDAWFHGVFGLHFCSVALVESPMKHAHRKAVEAALSAGGVVSFDPNVRLPLWDSPEALRKTVFDFLPLAHILKISDDELPFLTGADSVEDAVHTLFQGNVELIVLTKGKDGAEAFTKTQSAIVPGGGQKPVDTTGAGDAFIGAFLFRLMEWGLTPRELPSLPSDRLADALLFARNYADYSTLGHGAIPSYADAEQLRAFVESR